MAVNHVAAERERERAILLEKKSVALKGSLKHIDGFIKENIINKTCLYKSYF